MAAPPCQQLVHQPVDLDLGADIDPARRFVEDEDARLGQHPFRQHDLLLIAAREEHHLLASARSLDAQSVDEPARASG